MARKLGRTAEERMAIIRNQASELLWHGYIETTVDRAKEVRSYAESMLTLAINTYEDTVTVTKTVKDDKGEKVAMEFVNDGPKKLAARRKLMASLRDLQEIKQDGESKSAYKERTKDVNHPLIEKIFREHAVFYAERAAKLGQKGGYTRIIKLGQRRGDGAEMAKLELVK
ncbi:MAG: 50S ribosomal protein L17 [Clostridia bacterium]|nr:50S ribosomal protein L17 [Clostridia bacterium]MDE7329009.1 50S ribosomal protein L17 [Clostridia bacterium]